ncbi:MAG TPA: EthD family reductase [Acidisphaera sp.]|nr:EthD family reductase [Acidisphaera sp.]
MFVVTVMYPAGPKFDLDYYVKTHTPLVHDRMGPMGLKSVEILKGVGAPAGAATYQITCILSFASAESFQAAIGAHGAEIIGDIKNFTEAQPVMQFNEPVAA